MMSISGKRAEAGWIIFPEMPGRLVIFLRFAAVSAQFSGTAAAVFERNGITLDPAFIEIQQILSDHVIPQDPAGADLRPVQDLKLRSFGEPALVKDRVLIGIEVERMPFLQSPGLAGI